MTITSELHARSHRYKMSQALAMMSRLVRWESFTSRCTIVARVDVETDSQLRSLLERCGDVWEFDPEAGVLIRKHGVESDVRIEIGVAELWEDDVYRIVAEVEKALAF